MARDPELDQPIVAPAQSAEAGDPDKVPIADTDEMAVDSVDKSYWIACLEDAERAEQTWRERGRQIIQIYRNEHKMGRGKRLEDGGVTFNILYANTEVMLPAVYQKPPQPVVRSRFVKVTMMPVAPPPPPMPPPMASGPGMPPGMGLDAPPMPMPGGDPSFPPPGLADPAGAPPGAGLPGDPAATSGPPPGPGGIAPEPPPPLISAPPPVPIPGSPNPAPGRPAQADIETAAAIVQKALEIVVEDEHSDESVKAAIKDTLLPGRGVCRVRWTPIMEQQPVMAGDGTTPLPDPLQVRGIGDNGGPPMEEVKVWEMVGDEYVYWEDLLLDPVRSNADRQWIAFRHLFTKEQLESEFADSEQYKLLVGQGRVGDLLKWTDESAAKSPVGGGSAMKTASKLGAQIKKAMVWEIWDKTKRRIIWFIRETAGLVLRVDPDPLQLMGFFPIPAPMLAVTTTDSQIPRAYYDLYAKLASDLDEASERISRLTKMIKVRGAYNSASREVADLLTAEDGKMIPVDGVDMINGGLNNHIWMVPIDAWVNALDKLSLAKEQFKQSIYEIMGISDIMRGATKASETATAQRIKGTMGVSRLEDAKQKASNFVTDLLRMKAEIICQNFDPETLEAMTGEAVTPEVMAILRSDFSRTCAIDIEADSTTTLDLQGEQQAMSQIMMSVQGIMQGAQGMLQSGVIPPPFVMQMTLEFLKMLMHPIPYSRGVVQMINDMQAMLQQQQAQAAMMPPPPPGIPMGPGGPGGAPPNPAEGQAAPPMGPPSNGAMPATLM